MRFETYANVSLAGPEGGLSWNYANRVRLLRMSAGHCDAGIHSLLGPSIRPKRSRQSRAHHSPCPLTGALPEEVVAVVLDPAHFGIRLGDGATHQGHVHYLPPLLNVEVLSFFLASRLHSPAPSMNHHRQTMTELPSSP